MSTKTYGQTPSEIIRHYEAAAKRSEAARRFEQICRDHWYLPPYMLEGLEENSVPFRIKGQHYRQIRAHMKSIPLADRMDNHAFNKLAYGAYLLFGVPQRLESFVNNTNRRDKTRASALDLMKLIVFPPAATWQDVDFRAWGNAFIQTGIKRMGNRFIRLGPILKPVAARDGKISLMQTEFRAAMHAYRDILEEERLEKIFKLSVTFEKERDEFERILSYASQSPEAFPLAPSASLPDLVINGADFGMEDAVFRKISREDPRLYFLGDFDHCCERVTNYPQNLENTVAFARHSDISAYYIVEQAGNILAHSWAWRGKRGEMVFDGFESYKRNFNLGNLNDLIDSVIESLRHPDFSRLKCNGIFVGRSANHLKEIRNPCFGVHHQHIMPDYIKGIGMTQENLKMVSLPQPPPPYAQPYSRSSKPRRDDISFG